MTFIEKVVATAKAINAKEIGIFFPEVEDAPEKFTVMEDQITVQTEMSSKLFILPLEEAGYKSVNDHCRLWINLPNKEA